MGRCFILPIVFIFAFAMEGKPLVSIIMPSYNAERFISESMNSVMAQTYSNWELIVIDDASTDGSLETIRKIAGLDSRISVVETTENKGVAAARNIGFDHAHGKYIAFLDADDVWKPAKLEKQIAFMTEKKIAFSYTSYELLDEEGNDLKKVIHDSGDLTYRDYLKNTIIGCSTVIVDTEKTGLLSCPGIKNGDDMGLWLSIMKKGTMAKALREPLSYYRIKKTYRTMNGMANAISTWKVYRQLEKLSVFDTIICFVCYVFHAIKKRL